ncbi:hypothetical protein SAMN05216202_3296 [Pseudomonas mucidolens]|uniref:Uncharacterized protein n=1 Tax=Pseudomonas mucidolens TaxID=46679 RepID=A0A1H2NAP2_9PSED|nr:hypothetical protein [Pseudomonas mucidolens]SDV02251.1 hypothetical protein SAMN05216202_3296 [Pseudomonas mucidolens]SQH32352.1 Uncharacterised protein [Pseudomonas mucidolens]
MLLSRQKTGDANLQKPALVANTGELSLFVGVSLLAKNVNDNACILDKRGVFEFFASKLAPTRLN